MNFDRKTGRAPSYGPPMGSCCPRTFCCNIVSHCMANAYLRFVNVVSNYRCEQLFNVMNNAISRTRTRLTNKHLRSVRTGATINGNSTATEPRHRLQSSWSFLTVRTGAAINGNSTATEPRHRLQSSWSFLTVRTEATRGCRIYQYLKCRLTRRPHCSTGI
jgi:hypothetical protein